MTHGSDIKLFKNTLVVVYIIISFIKDRDQTPGPLLVILCLLANCGMVFLILIRIVFLIVIQPSTKMSLEPKSFGIFPKIPLCIRIILEK